MSKQQEKLLVFVDADVLFAGSASSSRHEASLVILRMAEITLIEAIASQQVIVEVERNLEAKIPVALPTFHLLVSRCLKIVESPSLAECQAYANLADKKDLSILVAAIQNQCPWLVTFNLQHFLPGHPEVTALRPGAFIRHVRAQLSQLQ